MGRVIREGLRVSSLSRFQSIFFHQAGNSIFNQNQSDKLESCPGKGEACHDPLRGQFRIKPFVRKGCLQPGLLQSREEIEFVGWDLVTFGGWKMQEIAFTFKLAPPMRMFSILSFEINFSRGPNYESLINC